VQGEREETGGEENGQAFHNGLAIAMLRFPRVKK